MLREYGQAEAFDDHDGRLAAGLAEANFELANRLGLREKPFVVRRVGGTTKVKARGISGTVLVAGRVLEIAPKFARRGDERHWRGAMLNVVARAQRRRAVAIPAGAWDGHLPSTFVDHVALTFATTLRAARERGPIRLYRNEVDRGNAVRGRLLYGPVEIVTALRNPGVMTYSVDELSGDNAANALLVRAGNELAAASQDAVVRIAVREAISPVEALLERGRHPAFTGRLPAQYDAYRVPLEIAAMLQRRNIALPGDAPALGHGLVLDTHRIFEAFVARSVEIAVQPLGLTAEHQVDVVYGKPRDGGAPLRTRPDVLVHDAAGEVLLIVDAKYKVPRCEDRLRGTASDNYQLLASMLAHKARNGVLLYPSRKPPQVHRWTVDIFGRTHQLAIATLDPGSFTGSLEREAFDTRLARLLQYLWNARAAE